jgi:hypothetical protein
VSVSIAELVRDLRADTGLVSPTASLPADVLDTYHRDVTGLLAHLDPADVPTDLPEAARLFLLSRGGASSLHLAPVRRADPGRRLARVSYLYSGTAPVETITDGEALHHKIRAVEVLGRNALSERIVWVPQGAEVQVAADGLLTLAPAPPRGRADLLRTLTEQEDGSALRVVAQLARNLITDSVVRLRARGSAGERYRDAWLLMDRDTAAQDNAEHLYRYLRAEQPEVNAWFVLRRDSVDWARLQAEGFRLIAHGSSEFFVALLHAKHLASSQVDGYVVRPFAKHRLGRPGWRYTFLQHGIITHDLSRWLNPKPIDLMVTTTDREQHSVIDDGRGYQLTDLEAVQTGLARHDRLFELAADSPRDSLVLMPTWRSELLGPQRGSNRRELLADFWQSRFARGWLELLNSPELKQLCQERGWQLTFVPHPNLQDYLASAPLPAHVIAHRFADIDVQQVIARSAAFVTDFSSLGSEAAMLELPVVYYQFDRDEFFHSRLYQPSDWTYENDGYGPIALTADATVGALRAIAERGVEPVYRDRIAAAFRHRDGRNRERIVAAMRALGA